MNNTTFNRFAVNPLARACALALLTGGMAVSGSSLLAATSAGTQIKNLATVTYEDAAGNVYSAQSNEAIITVAQVYSATIGVDVDATAAAGQTVYLPYVLTNTGNGPDVFDLTATNDISIADAIDSSSIQVFHDTNGSGVPDAGEPVVSSLSLQADDVVNLVVAVTVPSTAVAGNTLGITLNATARNGTGASVAASVTDLSSGGGRDGLDSTNESLITVTNDAVLVTTKTAVPDFANNQVSYTLTVRNNGNLPAKDVILFDGLPANTSLVTSGVSGMLVSNGDTLNTAANLSEVTLGLDLNADGFADDANESAIGLDLDNDGVISTDVISGVYAIDQQLAAGSSVSLTFTVQYNPATLGGGYVITNQGHASGDTDLNPGADSLVSSNQVQTVISADYAVDIADTGVGGQPGVNDGGDDDNTPDDVQTVDTAAAGGTVIFNSVITNNGNASDIFELSVNPGNFPAGTVFTFHDDSGVVQLSDTNGSGVDSGVIAGGGGTRNIVIKATLPSNATGSGPFSATVTAVSANDPSATPVSDDTTLTLGTIVIATADLHNSPNGVLNSDEDPLLAPYSAVTTFPGQTGTTVSIPLYIDNESGGSDSYVLSAGTSFDGTTLSGLLPGWSVQFYATDAAGNATGSALSNTPSIPGGALDFKIIAVVSIPANATQAVNDLVFDNNGDGTATRLLGNADADGDYPIFFQITSLNTGATDIKLDAIDVNADRLLSLVTPGSNQVEPGGSVIYGHTLSNNGNVDEVVELISGNSQAGWSHTVNIDTNNDGVPDTALGSLTPGNITVLQANGTSVIVTVSDSDGDGNPELTLSPSYSLPLSANVFAPSNAAPGTVDTLTITATNMDPAGPGVSVTDQTTIINGQVRLTKTVGLDALCDGEVDSGFAQVQAAAVAPGQCAIWRVVAENQGAADAQNVTITDAVTAFSTYQTGSLSYCLSSGCEVLPMTEAVDGDAGTLVGNTIVFYVGPGADATTAQGGTLVPGESATAQFSVKVN
ncbi:MAG: DUF11 domain-containing protein [Granulosicoccus sp.]|nr:DUF11 domain-containing protein [Granulosicoccus sp.]